MIGPPTVVKTGLPQTIRSWQATRVLSPVWFPDFGKTGFSPSPSWVWAADPRRYPIVRIVFASQKGLSASSKSSSFGESCSFITDEFRSHPKAPLNRRFQCWKQGFRDRFYHIYIYIYIWKGTNNRAQFRCFLVLITYKCRKIHYKCMKIHCYYIQKSF